MSNWLTRLLPPKIKRAKEGSSRKTHLPEGLWSKCPACEAVLYRTDLENNLQVCPKCSHHYRLTARVRVDLLLDAEGRSEIGAEIKPVDALKFVAGKKYSDQLNQGLKTTGESDAIIVVQGTIKTLPVVLAVFEFNFMGGSMGSVPGERFVRGVNQAINEKIPFICVSSSGGARMQEGLFSLMQMAKTTAVLTRLSEAGLPFISILADPTMGGVSASFAFVGDIVIAEPGALIGFAGPRVIEQTVRETLPEGFQRSEFLLAKGAIDRIIDRRELRDQLYELLALLQRLPTAA